MIEEINKSRHYSRMFRGCGHCYMLVDIFMAHYKNLDVMVTFANDKFTTYIPEKSMNLALNQGLNLMSNPERFKAFIQEYGQYRKDAVNLFGKLNRPLSKSEVKNVLSIFIRHYFYYSKTEFFYTDKAVEKSSHDPILGKNVAIMERIKFDGRKFMNQLFLQKNGYLKKFLKILSVQFKIPISKLELHSLKEIIRLFEGFHLRNALMKKRASSYLMISTNKKISYYEGTPAKKMIRKFIRDSVTGCRELVGVGTSKGRAVGHARVIEYTFDHEKSKETLSKMKKGEILIAEVTSPEYVVACHKAAAIVTNQGGMLSHAAVLSRELDIPCIIGTGQATQFFNTGDLVEVDADKGIVRKLR